MTQLTWDMVGERFFESGVDRGVLYLPDGSGVVWNGLVSVDEKSNDVSKPFYMDGVKYLDAEQLADFSATLKSFTYPDEFEQFENIGTVGNGLFVQDQPSKQFHLSYRTKIGNDIDGSDHGYQIHILYNLKAVPDTIPFSTIENNISPVVFSWSLFATPGSFSGFKSTAHIILDSTEINEFLLSTLENMLYGTDETDPELLVFSDFLQFIIEWDAITITDNGDGTWTATGPDELITMLNPTTFQITGADATYLDADTYTITDAEI